MQEIGIDFETRSKVDITECGASVYANDESTEVLCLAYTLDEGDTIQLWKRGDVPPQDLFDAIATGVQVHAHNAMFELLIWRHVCVARMGWPPVKDTQWRCTLASCARLALPRKLGVVGDALGLDIVKDAKGRQVMLKLARPRKPSKYNPSIWNENPADFETLYEYCKTDVAVEMLISKELGPMPESQVRVWQLDQQINLRGIPVDRDSLAAARAVVEERKEDYGKELAKLTGGTVTQASDAGGIRKWLNLAGVQTTTVDKEWVTDTLNRKDIMPDVRRVLEIRQHGGKSSTAKLSKMESFCDKDDRVRGGFRYHGASTGRWAGMGFQPHNYPSFGALGERMDESFFPMLHELHLGLITRDEFELVWGDVVVAMSSALRGMFLAPEGKKFYVCDFAGIEARVLAWLADETELLAMFPLEGDAGDSYKAMASDIYRVPVSAVTKDQRQIGKRAVLGCGFGMGGPRFAGSVQEATGQSILDYFPDSESWPETRRLVAEWEEYVGGSGSFGTPVAEMKPKAQAEYFKEPWEADRMLWAKEACRQKWKDEPQDYIRLWQAEQVGRKVVKQYRDSNPAIKSFWTALQQTCIDSISKPNRNHWCGRLCVSCDGEWMRIRLPSGRHLHYRNPRLIEVDAPWDKDKPKKERKQIPQIQFEAMVKHAWMKDRTYGGKLVENVTQAVAADLLMEAMLRVEHKGYTIIATIHDEIVSETDEDFGTLEDFERIMKQVPGWARGCPIDVEGFEGKRYRK